MKNYEIYIFLLFFFIATNMWAKSFTDINNKKTCNFFLIKEENKEVIIEKVELTEGQVQVFKDENLLSFVMIFPAGSKSGELIQKTQRIKGIVARYTKGKIKISILNIDGSQKEMPDIDIDKAINTNVKLSVTGANGYKKIYIIEKYDKIKEDDGPVLDMFAGKIPLNPGDYSFFIECFEAKESKFINGSTSYEIFHDWITIMCKMPDGKLARFVVDFGASTTVIPRKLLSANAKVSGLKMVEYSANGKKTSDAVMPGASGTVDNIAGITILDEFSFGNIVLTDFKVTVLNKFPKVFNDLGIKGILGRDILKETDLIEINNLNNENPEKNIVFTKKEKKFFDATYEIPFKIAGGYLFMDGKINNNKVSFLFDSGSGNSWISSDFLKENYIPYKIIEQNNKTTYGLDGKGIEYKSIEVENIQIGHVNYNNMQFEMGKIFVLENLGIINNAGLLGMNFLFNYKKIVFDFRKNVVLLWE